MVLVKVCGITNYEDAVAAVACGVDMLGFVFAESKRRVTPTEAAGIIKALEGCVMTVGVFVDEPVERVNEIARLCGLDYVQLHGSENHQYVSGLMVPFVKAFRAKDEGVIEEIKSFGAEMFILDSYDSHKAGGTGKRIDLRIAEKAAGLGKLILAGGLTPMNVAELVKRVRPYGVDVSSGVEVAPGKKDLQKIRKFVEEVRRCG